ncbi:MAG: hypothetical protein ABR95_06790 [Sphingobacteriales bacterium BACL12 MAG-120813-bin55]|nr:MAG: hypothetical protein ABR95_06790 [Sphingobacteriales bacterium BACL12 MAG-120813-bin55]
MDWDEIVELADTIYNSGLDTVYLLEDSVAETTGFRTGISFECSGGSAMNINLNKTVKNINKGQFGVNATGLFTTTTLYEDTTSEDQWQWISNLQPKVMRFPGGASSKFMHLLPYKDADGDGVLDSIKGYGYDLVEITRYFDAIDSVLEAPDNVAAILAASDATKVAWFGGDFSILKVFNEEYIKDYLLQDYLETGDIFIDQFINLINKIQIENGYTVEVIVCLNILTETAAQCLEIVEYLEAHGVNVVGVEMGNETANTFHRQIMRFNEFEDYWKYLDGQSVPFQSALETELGDTLFIPAAKRNFFLEFKNRAGVNYKIGLCAEGLDTSGHIFLNDPVQYGGLRAIDWNDALRSHYGDSHPGGSVKKFHAVILHTYNAPDSWYQECVIGPDTAAPFIDSIAYSCPIWETINQDDRLQDAFDAVRLNFRDFIKTEYDHDFELFNTEFNFNLTSGLKKDMWITEWNFKDEDTDDRGKVFTNGFMHGVLLQEWWMKNLKLNFTEGYRENFFKYSTLQNLAGGSAIAMLTPATKDVELDIVGKNYSPYNLGAGDPNKRNYYVRRTNWFVMELISEINKNNLQYFPVSTAAYTHNPNLPPTFFITPEKDYIYMYYTNSRCNEQRYVLDPSGMYPMFLAPVTLQNAEIHAIDAMQAYSTSGNSKLFDINECYDSILYSIEIDTFYTTS